MAIILSMETISAKISKHGTEFIDVLPTGHWLHYEYGVPEAPVQVMVEQVPVGKKWRVTMNVYIEETDA